MAFEKKKLRCIVRSNSKFIARWDVFVILLTLLYAFFMPFHMAFKSDQEMLLPLQLLILSSNVIFIVDLVINFRTTFVDTKTGIEVFEPKLIARHYVFGGRFISDMIASLPLDLFQRKNSSIELVILSMMKILRVTRITRLLRSLNLTDRAKMVLIVAYYNV